MKKYLLTAFSLVGVAFTHSDLLTCAGKYLANEEKRFAQVRLADA